jgi:hypothetical protein
MYVKKITFTDFAGETRTEEFMFNMSKSDIIQWRYSVNGGIEEVFRRIIDKNDQSALMNMVKDLIHRSYGERSIDGKKFEKRRNGVDLADDFEQTAAYDALFMELITDQKATADFVNGLMPPDLVAELEKYPKLPNGMVDVDAIKTNG